MINTPITPTKAHLELANHVLFSRDATGRLLSAPMAAQLIADSEARACDRLRHEAELDEQLQAVTENSLKIVTAECDRLRNLLTEWQNSAHIKGEAIDSLLIECDRLYAEVKSCGELSCDECNARTAALTNRAERAEAELAAELARSAKLVEGIKSILPKPPYHPDLEPEWVYLSGLLNELKGKQENVP
jgi:hypothetical protein